MSVTTTTKLSFKHKGKDCTAGCRSNSQSKSQSQVRSMRLREDGRRGPAAGNGYRARRHSEGPVGHRHHRYHHRPRADCKPRKKFWERYKERTRGARVSTTTRRLRYNATKSHPMKDTYNTYLVNLKRRRVSPLCSQAARTKTIDVFVLHWSPDVCLSKLGSIISRDAPALEREHARVFDGRRVQTGALTPVNRTRSSQKSST